MNGNWVPVLIVAIVMFAMVMKAKYRFNHRQSLSETPQEQAESLRLKDEVKQLKERLHVLERIAVDKENSVARQIEELRDK